MPRFIHRPIAACMLIACGCLTSAFIFGSGDKESKSERDAKAIHELFNSAVDAEQAGNFTKALDLFAKTTEKTFAYDKAYPKEDPEAMELIRVRCIFATENIRFALAIQSRESPVAVTPDLPPVAATPPAMAVESYAVPSRLIDGATRAMPAPAAPRPTAQADPAMNPAERIAWARDLMDLGRPGKARDELAAVLREEPGNTAARYLFALASLQDGDIETARDQLDDLALETPSEPVLLLLGALHYQRRDFTAALTAVRGARGLNPASAAACLNEAIVLAAMPGAPNGLAAAAYRQALLLGAAGEPALEARLNLP